MSLEKKLKQQKNGDNDMMIITLETNQKNQKQQQQQHQKHHRHRHHHHHYRPQIHTKHSSSYYPSYYTLNSLYSKPNFLCEFADVRETEQSLTDLLLDFHEGKINAFGENITLENMIKVREQQENLARLHFEMNIQQSSSNNTNNNNQSIINNDKSSMSSTSSLDRLKQRLNNNNNEQQLKNKLASTTTTTMSSLSLPSSPKIIITMNDDRNKTAKQSLSNQNNKNTNESLSPTPIPLSSSSSLSTIYSKPFSKSNMIKLIQNLQNLCESIEFLQSKNHNAMD